MKQLLALFVGVVAVIVFAAWTSGEGNLTDILGNSNKSSQKEALEGKETHSLTIDGQKIELEVARTPEKRSVGLSKHKELGENQGMLFIFEEKNVRPAFWMKGMNFSIDIIWIKEGKVSQISDNIPTVPPGTEDKQIPLYLPDNPVDHVLEIPSGEAKNKGIKIGSVIEIPDFGN